jgi:hypothetical protein
VDLQLSLPRARVLRKNVRLFNRNTLSIVRTLPPVTHFGQDIMGKIS